MCVFGVVWRPMPQQQQQQHNYTHRTCAAHLEGACFDAPQHYGMTAAVGTDNNKQGFMYTDSV